MSNSFQAHYQNAVIFQAWHLRVSYRFIFTFQKRREISLIPTVRLIDISNKSFNFLIALECNNFEVLGSLCII